MTTVVNHRIEENINIDVHPNKKVFRFKFDNF